MPDCHPQERPGAPWKGPVPDVSPCSSVCSQSQAAASTSGCWQPPGALPFVLRDGLTSGVHFRLCPEAEGWVVFSQPSEQWPFQVTLNMGGGSKEALGLGPSDSQKRLGWPLI